MNNDTIFALSSGHGKSGVAVIRISGDNLQEFAERILFPFAGEGVDLPKGKDGVVVPRHAYLVNLRDETNELIDQCVVIYFNAPHSFTGQDIIEIHCHGAPAVINKIFEFLRKSDMRMATPGEFSRRAFYSGKMDLADVDGLAALLNAQTDRQRAAALRSMMGGDSAIYSDWRRQMLEIAAYAAAMTDYNSDELPADISNTILTRIKTLYTAVSGALARYSRAHAITCGINIAIVGETNVGKSSLFNAILGTARAIVSDTPGTTRDVVSGTIDLDGFLVNLSDTAGLRETSDAIEQIGIERTNTEIENADIVIHVITPNDAAHQIRKNEILVVNKCDTCDTHNKANAIYVSAKTGAGLDTLIKQITMRIHEIADNKESDLMINARTYDLVRTAADELESALSGQDGDYDILAEHVRYAADAIGKILGQIGTNEILDATFGQLCLGK